VGRAGCHAHRAAARRRLLAGDLALRNAVQAAYQVSHLPTEQEVLTPIGKWRPYRSLATSYLFATA
jgi:3-methyladenine DNA glycosylase/8-oxoguanine DNA glycosylase